MIHYELRCQADHAFDGWFRDSGTFEQQAKRGQIACPTCGDTGIQRALMAPRLSRGGRPAIEAAREGSGADDGAKRVPAPTAAGEAKTVAHTSVAAIPDEMRVFLQRLRSEVERKCTYVGPAFAAAARRMHDGEIEAKPIYGEATPDEVEALHEDGIDIARIPWVPRSDS